MAHPGPPARQGRTFRWVLGLLGALLLAYLAQSGALVPLGKSLAERVGLATPPRTSAELQAFFTTPNLVYPDLPWQRPAAPLLDRLLADIDAARGSIGLAAFDLDLPDLTQALLRAQRRGVLVQVVADSENLLAPEASEQLGLLERAGVVVQFDRREPFMHHKFAVIDGRITWLGSWNMTANDTWRNNNNMLRLASRQIADSYTNELNQLLAGRFGTAKRSMQQPATRIGAAQVAVFFSPQDGVAQHVLDRLAAARRSIRFLAFSYTAAPIAEAMIARARAGVSVGGVVEAQNATGNNAAFAALQAAGIDVLLDGNCYILHHKLIVIDERTVITGSYNFTNSAEQSNDESLVIVDDAALARAYLEEFARVYAQAQAPTRCS